jgi:hypothetical protein
MCISSLSCSFYISLIRLTTNESVQTTTIFDTTDEEMNKTASITSHEIFTTTTVPQISKTIIHISILRSFFDLSLLYLLFQALLLFKPLQHPAHQSLLPLGKLI